MRLQLTRFKRTAGGYKRSDTNNLPHGRETADLLTEIAQMRINNPREPEAWSFSHFLNGRMSSETWKSASAIPLEYLAGNDPVARRAEVIEAAERLGYAYYLLDTQTRYKDRTFTIVFPLSETIIARRYSRIASVLASQLGLYNAAPGIQAHTHLVHLHNGSTMDYKTGPLINPEFFIKQTKDQAQEIDPLQFERPRPATVQLQKPTWTCAEDGLFAGL